MVSGTFGITSSQVEAMCQSHPPSLKLAPASSKLESAEDAPRTRDLRSPVLNTADMPEASLTGGRRGRKAYPKQLQRRQVGAAVKLTPDLDAVEEEEEGCDEDAETVVGDSTTWACPRCTFANASVMPLCEICELPRSAVSTDYAPVEASNSCLQASLSSHADVAEGTWDSTWTECEVSSMGSWLDVGDAQSESSEYVSADFDFVFEEGMVDAGAPRSFEIVGAASRAEEPEEASPALPRTWASRLRSSAGPSAAPLRPQRPKIMVPPLVRRRDALFSEAKAAEKRSEEEAEEEALFSQWPRFQRGAAQRRRMLGRSAWRGS